MSDFNVGDKVYFFYADCVRKILLPKYMHIIDGVIVDMDEGGDYVYVYVKGEIELLRFGWHFNGNYLFKSCDEAIKAMIKRLISFK